MMSSKYTPWYNISLAILSCVMMTRKIITWIVIHVESIPSALGQSATYYPHHLMFISCIISAFISKGENWLVLMSTWRDIIGKPHECVEQLILSDHVCLRSMNSRLLKLSIYTSTHFVSVIKKLSLNTVKCRNLIFIMHNTPMNIFLCHHYNATV